MFESESTPPIRFFVIRGEDNEPLLGENERILHRFASCELSFRVNEPVGRGELVVTSARVLWLGEERCFDFNVPAISLHAIIRDPESHPVPCLYCQLDNDNDSENVNGDEDENGHDDDDDIEGKWIKQCQTGELYFVPMEDTTTNNNNPLQSLFDAFSEAALLNPDPEQDDEDNNGAGEFFFNQEEVELGATSAQQQAALEDWDSKFVINSETNSVFASAGNNNDNDNNSN